MYLLKIKMFTALILNGKVHKLIEGGTDADGSFVGTFVSDDGDRVEIETLDGAALAVEDTIINLLQFLKS
jgi:hypothetical protein